jgi:hypothetical protein
MNSNPGRAPNDGPEQTTSTKAGEDQDPRALIARRAYEKWQARGCPEGDDARDWFEAEQELLAAVRPQPKATATTTATSASASRNRA